MYSWGQFRNLNNIKNLSTGEQNRQYFIYQNSMYYEKVSLLASAASSAAGAGGSKKEIISENTNNASISVDYINSTGIDDNGVIFGYVASGNVRISTVQLISSGLIPSKVNGVKISLSGEQAILDYVKIAKEADVYDYTLEFFEDTDSEGSIKSYFYDGIFYPFYFYVKLTSPNDEVIDFAELNGKIKIEAIDSNNNIYFLLEIPIVSGTNIAP